MPKFTQIEIGNKKKAAAQLPDEVVEEYMGYIDQLQKGHEGVLEFDEGENVSQARRALVEAGIRSRKYVKVRKPRGLPNVLRFQRITKAQFDKRQEKNRARGQKIRAARSSRSA